MSSSFSHSSRGVASLRAEVAELLAYEGISGVPRAWFESPGGDTLTPLQDAVSLNAVSSTAGSPNGGHASATTNFQSGQPQKITLEREEVRLLTLEGLAEMTATCRKCRLCEGRTNVVFGVGNTKRPLVAFVGEGPGAEEDKRGEPFVGRAGQLLTAAITKGMGLQREDVYICNVVKCRPPENRTPLPDEVEACIGYLHRQLELVQPQVIVTLGQPAQKAIIGRTEGITKIRGSWHEWRGFKVMPTLHPAYVLRNPVVKRDLWEDLQAVMKEVGLPIPPPSTESVK